jgi:hypothetical protein
MLISLCLRQFTCSKLLLFHGDNSLEWNVVGCYLFLLLLFSVVILIATGSLLESDLYYHLKCIQPLKSFYFILFIHQTCLSPLLVIA